MLQDGARAKQRDCPDPTCQAVSAIGDIWIRQRLERTVPSANNIAAASTIATPGNLATSMLSRSHRPLRQFHRCQAQGQQSCAAPGVRPGPATQAELSKRASCRLVLPLRRR